MKRIDHRPELQLKIQKQKNKLDALDWYPKKIDINNIRIYISKLAFEIIWPHFHGIALGKKTILFKNEHFSDDLLVHELCHLWQSQNDGYIRTLWAYLRYEYLENPYEKQARLSTKGNHDN